MTRPVATQPLLPAAPTSCLMALALAASLITPALPQAQRLTIGAPHLQVHYWPQQQELALTVLQQAVQDLKLISQSLDLNIQATIVIDIVRSHAEFVQRVGHNLPPWTLGVSQHHANHIVIKPQAPHALEELLRHELVHVALDMKMAPTRGEPPRWLHEGLAQWMSGEMTAAQKDVLGRAAVENRLLTLSQLEAAFGGQREQVDLAYAQSYTLVAFMADKGPPNAVAHFLQYLMDTGNELLALQRAMGQPLAVLEKRWLEDTRRRYLARGAPLTVELAIFAAMALLFIAAAVVRLRMAREIRQRMQEEERLQQLFHGVQPEDDYLEDTNDEWRLRG